MCRLNASPGWGKTIALHDRAQPPPLPLPIWRQPRAQGSGQPRAQGSLQVASQAVGGKALGGDRAKFDRLATQSAREQQVAVVRAVGVKFSNADDARKSAAQAWLLQLLTDDSEKIRRYAAAATSRIGGGDADELLLSLLRTGASVRERESAAAALADAGSHDAVASAVAILEGAPDALHIGPEQAVRHARAQSAAPSRSTR